MEREKEKREEEILREVDREKAVVKVLNIEMS